MTTWEARLRKQLHTTLGVKPHATTGWSHKDKWERDLEHQLEDSHGPVPPPRKSHFLVWLIIVLLVVILLALDFKSHGPISGLLRPHISYKKGTTDNKEVPFPTDQTAQIARLHEDLDKTRTELKTLQTYWKCTNDRVTILAGMCDENFYIIEGYGNLQDLIKLDAKWKMSRMPSHLRMSDKSIELYKRYLAE